MYILLNLMFFLIFRSRVKVTLSQFWTSLLGALNAFSNKDVSCCEAVVILVEECWECWRIYYDRWNVKRRITIPGWPDLQTIKCFHIWKLVAIQKKTFYVLAMTFMFSINDHCMDCMISYNCMALLWKPCFQVWPFYGNHDFKYDPFMETMFSSMVISWNACF